MLRVGFEPSIPLFERAKTFVTLERAANVIGLHLSKLHIRHGLLICHIKLNCITSTEEHKGEMK
jgi:hypothetical protein